MWLRSVFCTFGLPDNPFTSLSLSLSLLRVCLHVCVSGGGCAHSCYCSHRHHCVSSPWEGFCPTAPLSFNFPHSLIGKRRSDPSTPGHSLPLHILLSVTFTSAYLVFSTSFFFDSWLSSVWLTDIFWTLGWDRAFLMSHVNVLSNKGSWLRRNVSSHMKQ